MLSESICWTFEVALSRRGQILEIISSRTSTCGIAHFWLWGGSSCSDNRALVRCLQYSRPIPRHKVSKIPSYIFQRRQSIPEGTDRPSSFHVVSVNESQLMPCLFLKRRFFLIGWRMAEDYHTHLIIICEIYNYIFVSIQWCQRWSFNSIKIKESDRFTMSFLCSSTFASVILLSGVML